MGWVKFKAIPTSDADELDSYRKHRVWDFYHRPDRDLVGPHTNRELNLMLAGKKPLAMMDTPFFREGWQAVVKEQGWSWCYMIPMRGPLEDTVAIALPGHEFRIKKLARVYEQCRLKNGMTDLDHAKIGILLGYTKEQIWAFLDKISGRQAA